MGGGADGAALSLVCPFTLSKGEATAGLPGGYSPSDAMRAR